jgi:arabinogalactan oligomer / maltooligosaccharide transport system permease protein
MRTQTRFVYLFILLTIFTSCKQKDAQLRVTLWHQMVPAEREILMEAVQEYEAAHPTTQVVVLYKETEELRSGYQAAAMAGAGPELLYGPSDVMGPFQTMGIVADMQSYFPEDLQSKFVQGALTWLPTTEVVTDGTTGAAPTQELLQVGDRIGNHLALIYNRNYIDTPPTTTDELVQFAVANTLDPDGDGRMDRYGLVWNFTEPFFAIPFVTGFGAWVFEEGSQTVPNLGTKEMTDAFQFILDLQVTHGVLPAGCDYEMADALFKEGKAAMIINGDWSWGGSAGYLARPELNAAVAPLPVVSSTGIPMGPMVATKGYSLNPNASPEAAAEAGSLVRFLTSPEVQRRFMSRLKTLPSRIELMDDPLLEEDATLRASSIQMQQGRAMPVTAELRAVWDSMRPHYQALLGGQETASEATQRMQADAIKTIERMNAVLEPAPFAKNLRAIFLVLLVVFVAIKRKRFAELFSDLKKNRLAYIFILPAFLVIALTIVFPFGYNVVISLSNMSLRSFQNWQVIGFQNYVEVFSEAIFYSVFLKTVIWTAVNLIFHVSIGIFLAVIINGPVVGKSLYRVLLIIPWAVPAYITALTWRGMFDWEYGAINLMISKYLSMPMINWLGQPVEAFTACIMTNVWLGFPFMMVIALGGLQAVPQELYEAARVDGASRFTQFKTITLPLLKPVMLPAITLGTIWTFNNLNVIWLVSNGGEPSDKTHILVSYVYRAVFNLYRYGYGAALSMVIFVVLLVFSLLFLKKTKATDAVY